MRSAAHPTTTTTTTTTTTQLRTRPRGAAYNAQQNGPERAWFSFLSFFRSGVCFFPPPFPPRGGGGLFWRGFLFFSCCGLKMVFLITSRRCGLGCDMLSFWCSARQPPHAEKRRRSAVPASLSPLCAPRLPAEPAAQEAAHLCTPRSAESACLSGRTRGLARHRAACAGWGGKRRRVRAVPARRPSAPTGSHGPHLSPAKSLSSRYPRSVYE